MAISIAIFQFLSGCSASQRNKSVSEAFAVIQTADSALVAYDAKHEQDLIASAPDEATGKRMLSEWRIRVKSVQKAIDSGYRSIALYSVMKTDASWSEILAAVKIISDEIKELGVTN